MSLVHLPKDVSPETVLSTIEENGYAIIDRLASSDQMDALQAEISRYVEETHYGYTDSTGKLTRRTGSLIARSPTARSLIMNKTILAVCDRLFPKWGYHLSLTEVISLSPGAKAQFIHQDEIGYGDYPFPPDYWVQLSTLWAMTDYTEEMGATRVVPKSHGLARSLTFDVADTLPAVMERGSIIMYNAKTYHGGGENRSNRVRQAMNINYAIAWTRQEENQYLSTPLDVARTLPKDLLRVMGYNTMNGWGRVGDWIDPLSYILGEPTPIKEDEGFYADWGSTTKQSVGESR